MQERRRDGIEGFECTDESVSCMDLVYKHEKRLRLLCLPQPAHVEENSALFFLDAAALAARSARW